MLVTYSDMAAQTHSPFETLARVIEHLDANGCSVRRTEAAGSGEGGPLRATLEVSLPAAVGPTGLEPVGASIDDGLSVTYRVPSFPDPTGSLPPEHPPVSVATTGIEADDGNLVVTVGVTIDADGGAAVDTARTDGSAAEAVRGTTGAAGTATFGTGSTDADSRDEATAGGEPARGDDTAETSEEGSPAAGSGDDEFSAVRDESVPPYDDTSYLRRLYEACDTFAEMSDRIEMDVSAETVRRYTIDAGVHSPSTYETGNKSCEDADSGAIGTREPESGSESDAGGDDPSETAAEAGDNNRSETATEPRMADRSPPGEDGEPPTGTGARIGGSLPDEQLVADGIGLPEALTLREVVDAVADARTVHEVQRDIGLGYDRTRQLLTQLNVLDLVVGRVGAEPDRDGTVEAVTDRIRQRAPDTT